ncbi:hypothetical protein Psyc_0976 [Psychrobacter arcticus 273-4]|uniref:DUF4124 domain-containing protein n=1 Tax=Psychrobacter arcticus (strain DSM 17307 / VKM B-2377 / 273-4) TaxID=259536 RepID=Q4FT29_PSYA2|nr:hypothetical protein [Psychrobacter arcticus]AAZ18829.1 hypothetical protein Psyc_0976 [Psychrobacter arcticus 273-4]
MTSLLKNNILSKSMDLSLLIGLVIITASLYAPITNAAPIYKVLDEKTGQVTFTDRPQNHENKSGKQISEISVVTATRSTSNSATNSTAVNSNPTAPAKPMVASNTTPPALENASSTIQVPRVNYQLTMIEPSEERAYRRPAQNIVVNLQLKPALQAGDSVSVTLDGNEVAQGLSTSISTVDILPGSHVINAVVKNGKGQVLKQISRTIYVIQNTQTLQNNKKIAEQLLAYQRLPWHQKVLLKLRQDGKQPNMQSFTKPQADTPITLEQPAIK